MKTLYRPIIVLLIPLFLIYSSIACAEEKITPYEPETVESRPEEITPPVKEGVSGWWYLIGALLIAGVVAAAAGGGKQDSSSSGGSSGGGSGTVGVTW